MSIYKVARKGDKAFGYHEEAGLASKTMDTLGKVMDKVETAVESVIDKVTGSDGEEDGMDHEDHSVISGIDAVLDGNEEVEEIEDSD